MMNMKNKLIEYYKKEYEETKRLVTQEDRPSWVNPKEVVFNTINRLLGATQFVLNNELVYYSEVSSAYEFYYDELKKTA